MAPLVGRVFPRRQRKQWSPPNCVEADDVVAFLRLYGYSAADPQEWQPCQKNVDLSIRITNHVEVDKHTQYHVECSINWPAEDGTHNMQTWAAERRLLHFRMGLHDLVKHELGSRYAKLFSRARFAQHGGPKGTTTRLNKWFHRLAHCINSRTVPPAVVALVLTALEAPDAPSRKPCIRQMQLAASVSKPRCEYQRWEREATSANQSDAGTCRFEDLGLSDDSDEDAGKSEQAREPLDTTPRIRHVPADENVPSIFLRAPDDHLPCWPPSLPTGKGGDMALADVASTLDESNPSDDDVMSESSCAEQESCKLNDEGSLYGHSLSEVRAQLHHVTADASADSPEESSPNGDLSMDADDSYSMTPLRLAGLQCSGAENEDRLQELVQLRPVNATELEACTGGNAPNVQMQLRHVDAAEQSKLNSETKFQARLRARRQLVDLNKISGRGMLDF